VDRDEEEASREAFFVTMAGEPASAALENALGGT
jgi:hypothetical protein